MTTLDGAGAASYLSSLSNKLRHLAIAQLLFSKVEKQFLQTTVKAERLDNLGALFGCRSTQLRPKIRSVLSHPTGLRPRAAAYNMGLKWRSRNAENARDFRIAES